MGTIDTGKIEEALDALPEDVGQVILTLGERTDAFYAIVYLLERSDRGWDVLLRDIKATVGALGFVLPFQKREGDKKTPTGVYPVEFAFGYEREVKTKMEYIEMTEKDVWVDDVTSRDYNRWVKIEETDGRSFELMRRMDGKYKYGLVIGYNRNPVIPGMGSAIFIHVWDGEEVPTEGCIALSEEDILKILSLLDPRKKPVVVIGTVETLGYLSLNGGTDGI
ncbi:MAG: L,D-transpeptidase family protein [Syntrophorhabdaceae bacterium]|nr:L,D-transpeptidase family protein [Syntrophorhabdaceae bacterium]